MRWYRIPTELVPVLGNGEVFSQHPRREQDRLLNLLVAGAAADIPLDALLDLGEGWIGFNIQERLCADDHPGGAEAALHRPRLGEGVGVDRRLAFAQPLDGGHTLALKL